MDLEDLAGYSLRRKLGSGSAGTVWQVRDLASGRNAVLKRLSITAIPDQNQLREDLTILQRLRHPHIARLLEFRETRTEWLIISQYLVAGSLTALLTRRPPLSPAELVTLLTPLTEALDHLHRSGLTHGRLTPTNTLFDADGRPVLTDTALHLHLQPTTAPAYGPTDDLLALATLSHQAGADPAVFTPTLFTTTPPQDLPRHLLTLAAPEPIDLAFPEDTTPAHPTPPPPPTDTPIDLSRSPLTPRPPTLPPPTPPSAQAAKPHPPTPPKVPKPPRRPRTLRRPNRTRHPPTATPINPLTRLAPPTPTPATTSAAPPPPTPPSAITAPVPTAASSLTAAPLATPSTPTSTSAFAATPAATPPASTSAHANAPAMTAPTLPIDAARPAIPPASVLATAPRATSPTPTPTSTPVATPTRPDRPRTRRHRWRRNQMVWRRLAMRVPHPAYGVLAAAALGAVIVLLIGIATVRALDTPTTSTAASTRPTTPPTPTSATTPTSPTNATTPTYAATPTAPTGATTPPMPTRLPTTAAGSRTEASDWTLTLQALDVQRAHAFWTLDLDVLDKIYAPGSQPWKADRDLLATYRKQQVRVQGLRIQIDKATIAHQTPTTVTLKTTDHLTAGEAIDRTGTSTPLPPGTPTTRLITLTKTPTRRITTITPA